MVGLVDAGFDLLEVEGWRCAALAGWMLVASAS
jgi:hypothetical protein